jgi:tetratricopeptide (TPR) repeat protein
MSPSDVVKPAQGPAIAATETVDSLLARGLNHHRRNALAEAERLYVQALAIAPDNPDALHLMGVLRQQVGDFAGAVDLIQRSLAAKPAAHVYANLCNALNQLGRWAEAETAGRSAVWMDPTAPAAHCNLGVAQRGLKKLSEAAATFRGALALSPAYAGALSNLGVVLTELGELEEAESVLRRALAIEPNGQAWFNLANALLRQMRWSDAYDAFVTARSLAPAMADIHANLGAACKAMGRLDEAVASYRRAAELAPGNAVALHNYGMILGEAKRHEEAVAALRAAADLAPDKAAIYVDLGAAFYHVAKARQNAVSPGLFDQAIIALERAVALDVTMPAARYNLGLALLDRGRIDEAATRFREAMALQADYAEAQCNLGHCLAELGQFKEATQHCRRALALKPELVEAQSTLGNIAVGRHDLEAAEIAYRIAVTQRPTMGGAWCNLGVALFRQGRSEEALEACDQALIYSPELADAHWNRALVLLQRGEYAQGWAEYAWRLRRARRIREDAGFTQPLWDGSPLDGGVLMLHTEQGFGDAIQCARFIPPAARQAGRAILQAQRPLMRLFSHLPGVEAVLPDDAPLTPMVDRRLPLFSLPHLFAPTLESLKDPTRAQQVPYLKIAPDLIGLWSERLREATAGDGALRVGIVWSGNVGSEAELGRSIPLQAFAGLDLPGVRLISLQKGDGLHELAGARAAGMSVTELGPAFDVCDFADTGAIVENLDLVICCDTAVAHLAGALGRPVWLAVNAVADWRWLLHRTDSPWYPSLKVYRQPSRGDWDGLFAKMAADLEGLASGRRTAGFGGTPKRKRKAKR